MTVGRIIFVVLQAGKGHTRSDGSQTHALSRSAVVRLRSACLGIESRRIRDHPSLAETTTRAPFTVLWLEVEPKLPRNVQLSVTNIPVRTQLVNYVVHAQV